MIQLIGISKTFQSQTQKIDALKNIDLDINSGDIYGIIGFSGAGKSTLIRCMNLLERPESGKVVVDGVELMSLNALQLRKARMRMGMIFQHFNLMQSRTVFQNVAFPLKHSPLSKAEKHEKIISLLKLVDLYDKLQAYPSQLSGGQKQRVAIARSLANDPKVLLCDEATSALDPQTTKSILNLLQEVNQRLHITIVIITHEMSVVKQICHHVAIMDHGEIIEKGDILEIFSKPKTKVTQDFIVSTSQLASVEELIKTDSAITQLKKGQQLIKLNYDDVSTSKALISEISRNFQVDVNIIFGNVEVLKGSVLGDMIVILDGEQKAIDDAIDYLTKHDVKVEVMKKC